VGVTETWVPLEDLELSVPAFNCLKREGFTTADELMLLSEADLRAIPNLGSAAVEEIKQALATLGLRLLG
jgi:DNA-directed RNA polymerase subunit alpha